MARRYLKLLLAGNQSYEEGLILQENAKKFLRQNECLGTLILLEHKPVYTVGIRKYKLTQHENPYNLVIDKSKLIDLGADYYETNRGGLITFHGPGQLVVYPILNLQHVFDDTYLRKKSVESLNHIKLYVKLVIDCMTKVSREVGAFSIFSKITPSTLTGSWHIPNIKSYNAAIDFDLFCEINKLPGTNTQFVNFLPQKVGALGIRFSDYITTHGIALNCNVDLNWYKHIDPCGLNSSMKHMSNEQTTYLPVTSLSKLLDSEITVKKILPIFLNIFKQDFMVEYI